jgi:hypothetical protein
MTRVWFRRLTSCAATKTFTADTLVKGNGEKDLEVQIPGLAKFAEIVSKYLSFAFSNAVLQSTKDGRKSKHRVKVVYF